METIPMPLKVEWSTVLVDCGGLCVACKTVNGLVLIILLLLCVANLDLNYLVKIDII